MSKNYNKYFNGNNNFNSVEPEETTNLVTPEEDQEETVVVVPEPETPTAPEAIPEQPKPLYGINNCKKLNVRTEPNKDADVVCVLDITSTFEIDEIESNPEWVRVTYNAGAEGFNGYCMKQYVVIK